MPKISVVIPAYNVGAYLERCLDSLKAQTYEDFEAVVVDDKSPDDCGAIAERYAKADKRFRVVHHERNLGRHRARCSGVAAATGEYFAFLDGDDEFEPTMLELAVARLEESGADIVHTGMSFLAEGGVSEEERLSMESYANRPSAYETGTDVIRAIFDESRGQLVDWRVTQRVWRGDIVRKGFELMSRTSLERAEDGYECFVLAALAQSSEPYEELTGYVYHYGIGVTGASAITPERFGLFCRQFRDCLDAGKEFIDEQGGGEALTASLVGMRHKMLELLSNDLRFRVAREEWPTAFGYLVEEFGPAEAGREAWRFVRDAAYPYVRDARPVVEGDELYGFLPLAESVEVDEDDDCVEAERYREMRRVAEDHLAVIRRVEDFRATLDPSIRIFVTTHKRVDVPKSAILQPVQVGPGLKRHRYLDAIHDDEGGNITELNPLYCELTTQYWAWKNVQADYVGFCHYRRYFSFAGKRFEENAFGEVMDRFIDEKTCARYGLDDESICAAVEGYDVITTGFHDLRGFPGPFKTPREHWAAAWRLHERDLGVMADIVMTAHPDYAADVEAFLDGHVSCFCNMYIMRKEIFDDYCAWLFPLLEEFCRLTDMSHYSHEALRTPGHLAERLFNIYYLHAQRMGAAWKTRELQCVHFESPDSFSPTVAPLCERRRDVDPAKVIPIVLAADNNYVPMLMTTILSLAENADPERLLDIVVFEQDITAERKAEMAATLRRFPNVSLRFHNVWRQVVSYDLATSNQHISVETYYRFLIQEILPGYDKVLYLDSDLCVLGDVAKLFDTDIEGQLLAAVTDIDFVGNVCGADPARMDYARDILGLDDPYGYFQAGVLVLNTGELRKLHSVREWLEMAATGGFIYDDQDILNAECRGRVVTLAPEWNVMHDCDGRVGKVFSFAPADLYDAYQDARRHPQIIHYAGYEKPWTHARCDFARTYWSYARRTSFYEELLEWIPRSMAQSFVTRDEKPKPPKALPVTSPLRAVIDPIAPFGTRRREALKLMGRTVNKIRGIEISPGDGE